VYVYFVLDNATAHIETCSAALLQEVFIEWLITDAIDFFLIGMAIVCG
jgi:hypothetical protein